MSNFNLSQAKQNALLRMAGKQLGADPNQLKDQLESGNLQDVVQSLNPEAQQKINGLLQNPDALNALLSSDQVQGLLKNLSGN